MKIVKELKNKKKLIVVIIAGLLIVSLGLSLAYFDFNIIGSETDTTIIGEGGTMRIDYDGGAIIESNIMFPDDAPFATKNFTVTGFNDTDLAMNYNISLIVTTNTFSHGGIKYKLTSTNTGSNGIVVPSISTMKDLATGTKDILLGNGSFTGPTSGDKVHTYSLQLYYPITGGDQSYDQGKLFNAYVLVEKGIGASNEYLTDAIFDDYGGASSITEAPAGTFANINGSTDNLMYKMEDDYGMSYYLRGAKDYINNNIIFAEHQWKIVRINGDGSIRLVYNGTCPNNSCTINSTGESTQIGTSTYNINYDDNKYLGYKYGGLNGAASTSRVQATTNETNSTIKTYLDTWYANNILNTDYEDYISDTLFCNDRQLQSEVGGSSTGTGYSNSQTYYAAYYRLNTKKIPNIKCGLKNDRFTVADITIGNGSLTHPIGLITPDELALAGFKYLTENTTNYLYTNQDWWTMGPGGLLGDGSAYIWFLYMSSRLLSGSYYVADEIGVRGVINLKPNTKIVGTGTTSDPYIVTDELSLGNKILADYGGKENITEAPVSLFSSISTPTENAMYKMEDDYGTSYYLRGAKNFVPNNLIFAEHQWKIVRINGDGSVRLIYNGTCPNNSCTINSTGTSTQMGTSAFNSSNNDNKYLGYMYGGAAGVASTSRVQATTNETSSTMKTYLDSWYSTNISGTDYEDYISDTLFCNDRQLQSEVGGPPPELYTGDGYGDSETYYAAYYRLKTNKNPNIKCGLQNDRFTVNDTTIGNGALTYPIGLLSPDEANITGVNFSGYVCSNYLCNNQVWRTMGPSHFSSIRYAYTYLISIYGYLHTSNAVSNSYGVRGVLNLKPLTLATGIGTTSDPYVVQ